ncbi:hypothetical protein Acor_36550 [Acrocarpospora corrugata]|uniref:Peptidase C39-like domain-containing protein n=1 Tax=Acrocarpospora corrugata TaxID=35763 RepID=A0A5M3W374_9ACTN|nr:hypothetical protein [Acrocarpospora corrugata]GES01591.1 hypothetical protein Acor_36550 [Acrocarpospora corrugata]
MPTLHRALAATTAGLALAIAALTAQPSPAAAAGPCPDGKVWRQARAAGDHTCVVPSAVGRRMTPLDPARHGFKFDNQFQTQVIAEVRFGGLCGGWSYAALDHFYNNRPIPTQDTLPASGSALHRYIFDRQVESIAATLDKWTELTVNPFGWRTAEFFNWGLQGFTGGRLQELRESIDAGRPVPLGLFKPTGNLLGPHHQAIAIGYDLGGYAGDFGPRQTDLKIYVLDPNFPGKISTLVPNPATLTYSYLEHPEKVWRTYFVDTRYRPRNPPAFPNPPAAPAPTTVNELILDLATGADDLRGGTDNVNATIHIGGQPPVSVPNLNRGARWIGWHTQTVRIPLPRPALATQLSGLVLSTTFGGGLGGDNWNLDLLRVRSPQGRIFFERSGSPLVRFTGDNRPFTAPLR